MALIDEESPNRKIQGFSVFPSRTKAEELALEKQQTCAFRQQHRYSENAE